MKNKIELKINSNKKSRRDFLSKSLQLGLTASAAWLPTFRVEAFSSATTCAKPINFPTTITLYQQAYENWSGEIKIDGMWTCSPKNEAEVLQIVNWAYANAYKVRPRGNMHNWSPILISPQTTCTAPVILVNMTDHMTKVSIATGKPARITAQTGVQMLNLMQQMENVGLGFVATPAPGDLTLGGVLAIGGHGTAIPAANETPTQGQTYGSMSNNIISLTAVVWDASKKQYVLKVFERTNPESAAFLTHVGRAFITQVTLQGASNSRLRCRSYTDISNDELFAPAGSTGRTFDFYLKQSGRAEAIIFPFTNESWLKVWTVHPQIPLLSRVVLGAFNYSFSDLLPKAISDLVSQISLGAANLTPLFGNTQFKAVKTGLAATLSTDLWGWSKNTLLYIRPSTLRVTANGYAILTRRNNVQNVVNRYFNFYKQKEAEYQKRGLFPMNGPIEIRVTGLDQPSEVTISGAVAPLLSAVTPIPGRPELNVAVWVDNLCIPKTPIAAQFYQELETWIFKEFSGADAVTRVEWSKGWAYTDSGAWENNSIMTNAIPNSLQIGQSLDNWTTAKSIFNQYDPHRLYSSPLHDRLGL